MARLNKKAKAAAQEYDFDLDKIFAASQTAAERERSAAILAAEEMLEELGKKPKYEELNTLQPRQNKSKSKSTRRRSSSSSSSSSSSGSFGATRKVKRILDLQDVQYLKDSGIADLATKWGYDSYGSTHTRFEAKTHMPKYNDPEVFGFHLQRYTDPIFRPLAKLRDGVDDDFVPYDFEAFKNRVILPAADKKSLREIVGTFFEVDDVERLLTEYRSFCAGKRKKVFRILGRAIDSLFLIRDGDLEGAASI